MIQFGSCHGKPGTHRHIKSESLEICTNIVNDVITSLSHPESLTSVINTLEYSTSRQIIDQKASFNADIREEFDQEEMHLDADISRREDYLEAVSHQEDLTIEKPLQKVLGNNIVSDPRSTETIETCVTLLDPSSNHAPSESSISNSHGGKYIGMLFRVIIVFKILI